MLSDIIGQQVAVKVIRNYLRDGHVAGSFLFVGPAHVGKATAAAQFAKAMLCDDPQPGPDCCDACSSCRAIDAGKHPDFRSVSPAGPSRILRLPQIWPRDGIKDFPPESALLHDLHFSPVRGKRRVFVIEDADALNDDTANSLLKVLEEPPSYATFILTAPSPSAVLPTIFSRCHTVRFQSVPGALVAETLIARGAADEAKARFLAALTQGRIGSALDLAGDHDLQTARETVLLVAGRLSTSRAPIHALKLADDLRKAGSKLGASKKESGDGAAEGSGRQGSSAALEILAFWYHDLLVLAGNGDRSALINSDHAAELQRIAGEYNPDLLLKAIELILSIRHCIERNANAQIAFEALALRLVALRPAGVRSAR